MTTIPLVVLFGISAALGLFMGVQYLRGVRNKPAMVAVHLVLGLIGLEAMASILKHNNAGATAAYAGVGAWAAGLLAAGVFMGFMVPIMAKPKPASVPVLLGIHAAVGALGVGVVFWWAYLVASA